MARSHRESNDTKSCDSVAKTPAATLSLKSHSSLTQVSLERTVRRHADGTEVRACLHVVLLEFSEDVFAVGVLAKRAKVRPYLVDEHLSLRLLGDVDHLLDDVVRKLVLHHCIEGAVRKKKIQETLFYVGLYRNINAIELLSDYKIKRVLSTQKA